jgi:hypothetical protein
MTEHRLYSDSEVTRIFERAAEAQVEHGAQRGLVHAEGMSLEQLQEIGREAGISAEAIARAARELHREQASTRTFMGLPIGVGLTVELDRPLDDAEWSRLVGDLRETFHARGRVREDGAFRQWTNGNLQALVEPTPNGHRVRLSTVKGTARPYMSAGGAMIGTAAIMTALAAFQGTLADPGFIRSSMMVAAIGLGMFAAGSIPLPGWARRRRQQMEEIADKL